MDVAPGQGDHVGDAHGRRPQLPDDGPIPLVLCGRALHLVLVGGVDRTHERTDRRDGDVPGGPGRSVLRHRGLCDGAAVLDAASDEPSSYQSSTDDDIIDASTVHNLDPAAVDFVDASALELNLDEPPNNDEVGVRGGGVGVESGTGTMRHASV